jgi:hypothetical protein
MIDELQLVSMATPRPGFLAYGIDVVWIRPDPPFSRNASRVAVYVTTLLAAAFAVFHAARQQSSEITKSNHIDAFRVGASIYVGTFVAIGANFQYRLMFLLFAVPQLVTWAGSCQRYMRIVAVVTIACVITTLRSFFIFGIFPRSVLDWTAQWAVCVGLVYLLTYSSLQWTKVWFVRMGSFRRWRS